MDNLCVCDFFGMTIGLKYVGSKVVCVKLGGGECTFNKWFSQIIYISMNDPEELLQLQMLKGGGSILSVIKMLRPGQKVLHLSF